MKIAIVGAGGVGGYFGGRLLAAGADVRFLARGAHLDAMRTIGLRIESPKGNVHLPRVEATDDPAAIGPSDVVFFTVKLYDSESAIGALKPLLGPDTVVIPFQNGVESVGMLTRAIGADHTAGGTAYITAVVAQPGLIRHTVMDSLFVGETDGRPTARLEVVVKTRPAQAAPAASRGRAQIVLTVFRPIADWLWAASRCRTSRSLVSRDSRQRRTAWLAFYRVKFSIKWVVL